MLSFFFKETFHCFVHDGDEKDYIRCVFSFDKVSELDTIISEKLSSFFLTRSSVVSELFMKLKDLADEQMADHEKKILTKALFAQLLVYIKEDICFQNSNVSNITQSAVEYIKNNTDKPLTVKSLSNELHISESYLAHTFKKDLHIPIHKYILEVRLMLANKKIKNSVPPTQAALECGFRDYSGFYKQYKKMFGVSPMRTKYE